MCGVTSLPTSADWEWGIPVLNQIDGPEVLHIHFANTVTVTGLATLFAPAHADDGKFGNVAIGDIDGSDTFLFSQNGTTFNSVTFGNANTFHGVNVSGQDFYFKEDGSTQPQFYVSALTYVTGTVGTQCTNGCAVPDLWWRGSAGPRDGVRRARRLVAAA